MIIDSELKAYVFGYIVNNIKSIKSHEIVVDVEKIFSYKNVNELEIYDNVTSYGKYISNANNDLVVTSIDIISDIKNNIDISYFVKNNERYVGDFLLAYFEKNATFCKGECVITFDTEEKSKAFTETFQIPFKQQMFFNLYQIVYSNTNLLDLYGYIYGNAKYFINKELQREFQKCLSIDEIPVIEFQRSTNNAVIPTKANFSDVGYDLTVIGIHKVINSKTILCNTGIKLNIPNSYYVEIAPRSSIIKSGYMLANSIGIIDVSYKGELLVALTKVDEESPSIQFPFRCCQLIVRKQVFPIMKEVDDITISKRGEGGFGSSG